MLQAFLFVYLLEIIQILFILTLVVYFLFFGIVMFNRCLLIFSLLVGLSSVSRASEEGLWDFLEDLQPLTSSPFSGDLSLESGEGIFASNSSSEPEMSPEPSQIPLTAAGGNDNSSAQHARNTSRKRQREKSTDRSVNQAQPKQSKVNPLRELANINSHLGKAFMLMLKAQYLDACVEYKKAFTITNKMCLTVPSYNYSRYATALYYTDDLDYSLLWFNYAIQIAIINRAPMPIEIVQFREFVSNKLQASKK